MKKFLRIALVFALAGATLMYTGCTKDYSGDIDDLNSEVSSLQSSVQSLQTQVASALSEAQKALSEAQAAAKLANAAEESAEIDALAAKATTLEAAMQTVNDVLAGKANAADLAEAKAALEAAIATINDVLEGKADAAEVAATYATIEALAGKADATDLATVKAALEALQANVAENKAAFDNTKAALEAAIATINAALEGKADKAEVAATYATIAALTETNNTLAALQTTVEGLAATVAANKEAGEAADAAIIADLAKANQAIADAAAAANQAVADLKAEVKDMLKDYYTKAEIDALIGDLNTSLDDLKEYIDGKLLAIDVLSNKVLMSASYAEFKGVFASDGSKYDNATLKPARKWEGKVPETAIVDAANTGNFEIQINPSDYPVDKIAFTVENKLGDELPFEITPAPTKGNPGIYTLSYNAKHFETIEEVNEAIENLKDYDEYNAAALVADGNIRSSYDDMSARVSIVTRKNFVDAWTSFTFAETNDKNQIYTDELTGEVNVVPVGNADKIFDWYISGLKSSATEATKLGIKIDDKTVTYDPELLKKYFLNAHGKLGKKDAEGKVISAPEVTFNISYMTIAGYVYDTKTVSFTFADPKPEVEEIDAIEFEWADPAVEHQANINSEKQFVNIDLTKAFAEWGITDQKSLEYIDFDEAEYIKDITVDAYYYATDDDFDGTGLFRFTTDVLSAEDFGWTVKDKTGKDVFLPNLNLLFVKDYFARTTETFGLVDLIGKTVYANISFADADGNVCYKVNDIPVEISDPAFETWFTWTPKKTLVDENYTPSLNLKEWFVSNKKADPTSAASVMWVDDEEADIFTFSYAFDEDEEENTTDFINYQTENETYTETITGLKYSWVNRTYTIAPVSFEVVTLDNGGEAADYTINFNPAIELKRTAGGDNHWYAYNSALVPNNNPNTYQGTFTLAGNLGNTITIASETVQKPTRVRAPQTNNINCDSEGNLTQYTYLKVSDVAVADAEEFYMCSVTDRRGNVSYQWRTSEGYGYTKVDGKDPVWIYALENEDHPTLQSSMIWNATSKTWVDNELYTIVLDRYTPTKGDATYAIKISPKETSYDPAETVRVKLSLEKAGLSYIDDGADIEVTGDTIEVEFTINLIY